MNVLKIPVAFDSTYKELKLRIISSECSYPIAFDSTYKELKLESIKPIFKSGIFFWLYL